MSRSRFRRLLRVLDTATLFFSLVILSSLLWAGAGWTLIWLPISWILPEFFPGFSSAFGSISGLYVAGVFASIGLRWGWKRWRAELNREAQNSHPESLKK